jgi:hypothetical protein
MPIRDVVGPRTAVELTSTELLASLSYVERKFDDASIAEYLFGPARPDVPELKEAK